MNTTRAKQLGTDDTFLQLMRLDGSMVLKLLGLSAQEAAKYQFKATVLKERKLAPDVQGFPIFKSDTGRVFLEFQGYPDPFVRYRLLASIYLGCTHEGYKGKVLAAIIYTSKKYQEEALSLNVFADQPGCQVNDCIQEIVLTDYTESQLLAIDPKLVILAPFTLPTTTDKTTLLQAGQRWLQQVRQHYPPTQHREALDVLGLFLLHRFGRLTSYEEVKAMLNFDLLDTLAGQDIWQKGRQEGSLETTQKLLVQALMERFGKVSSKTISRLNTITQEDILNQLFREALRCQSQLAFNRHLSKLA
jgi:Protein of unknown function (DUF2887)